MANILRQKYVDYILYFPRLPMDAHHRSRLSSLVFLVLAAGLAACAGDGTLPPEARAPERAALLLNPLCAGSGGTTHAAATVTTTQNWWPSGNPHRVTGTQTVSTGGELRLRPGVLACFDYGTGIVAASGGQLAVDGDDTARIVLTASDLATGWGGITLSDLPAASSFIGHARIEYVSLHSVAVTAEDDHLVVLDSTVIRQSGAAVNLRSPQSRILDSRVDTTTDRGTPAVQLGDSTRFTRTAVRGAAGDGVYVPGFGVQVNGGRIEGSGARGIMVLGSVASAQPVRITGSGGYPFEGWVETLARLYGTSAAQDSLLGNARDTISILGGGLATAVYVRADLPWRVKGTFYVYNGGSLRAEPGAGLVFNPTQGILADSGRILARGTASQPVVFTAEDPAQRWGGIHLYGQPSSASLLTNVRMEHVAYLEAAVIASGNHPVAIDSSVFRMNGRAAALYSSGSRISRTRVDTTLQANAPAVELDAGASIESTLIRGSSGVGLLVLSSSANVYSCEIRDSAAEGIVLAQAAQVRNCNLVNNAAEGIENADTVTADVENNWWGDAGGPAGTNGDGAAGPLDYTPWRTSAYTLPYVP